LKLEHQEERVRNRYRSFYICIAFAMVSTLSLMAQSARADGQPWEGPELKSSDSGRILLIALDEAPALGVSSESELPDAPSSAKADASTADPTPSPVVKKDSQGALPAATGGRLSPDRSVIDRNYLLVTGGMFGASIANAELTVRCLQVQASCNDVPSFLKSRTALYGIGIPADFGVAYLTYIMKKRHNSIWYVPAALVTGANLFFGVRAYRWSQDPSTLGSATAP
jgi:hypothetical protein